MIVSLGVFMRIESRFGHGRSCTSFKQLLLTLIFAPLHVNMLAQVLLGGLRGCQIWHLYQIRLMFFVRPFVHLIFYICLIPIWSIIFNEGSSQQLPYTTAAIVSFTLLIVYSFAMLKRSADAELDA